MEAVVEQFSDYSFSDSCSMNIDSSAVDPSASRASRDGRGALIDMDPFDFDVQLPLAGEPWAAPALVHADQIIADGRLLPLPLVHQPKRSTEGSSSPSNTPVLLRSPSVDSSDSLANRSLSCRSYMEIGRRLSSSNSSTLSSIQSSSSSSSSTSGSGRSSREKKALRYLYCFLQPFYKTRGLSCKVWSSSSSPRKSGDAISGSHRSNMTAADVGTETVIHDAVLHCKNSNFGKSWSLEE